MAGGNSVCRVLHLWGRPSAVRDGTRVFMRTAQHEHAPGTDTWSGDPGARKRSGENLG